jgi:hypothetical protein
LKASNWAGRVLVALLVPVPACAIVLGVQDQPTDVVASICGCNQLAQYFAVGADCNTTLSNRLSLAPADVRANWLMTYATADCSLCKNAHICFYTAPACVPSGNPCTVSSECCSAVKSPLLACSHGACQ